MTTFDHIFAGVPNSVSTILAMFTGRIAARANQKALEASRGRPTLPEILRSHGSHNEFLLTGPTNALVTDIVGRGFDRALDMHSAWPGDPKNVRLTWGLDDRVLFDYARTFLDAQRADSPRSSGQLKTNGLADSTALLAFGDHGQAFGEHRGNYVHSKELYRENEHVPMFLLHPTRLGLPPGIAQLVAIADVMPTALDLLGIDAPPGDGMSLLNDAPERLLFQMTPFGPGVAGFRSTRYAYSLSRTGRELLFDLQADPHEQHNVAHLQPDVATQFRRRLTGPQGSRCRVRSLLIGGSTSARAAETRSARRVHPNACTARRLAAAHTSARRAPKCRSRPRAIRRRSQDATPA